MNRRPPRVLIVDDDEEMMILLQQELGQGNIEVQGVCSGAEALAWLEKEEASLILLDLSLPDMTGQELLTSLHKRGQKVPFVVVSEMGDVRLTVEMMRIGALDFILKDSQLTELILPVVKRVFAVLEARRKFDESEFRFQQISDTIDDVFWMMSPKNDRFLYVSPAFERIWGKSRQSLYTDSSIWLQATVAEDHSKYLRHMSFLRGGYEKDFDLVYRIRDRQGEVCWIRDRAFAKRDESGELLYFIGVATDVTAQKVLEGQALEATEAERIRIGQDIHDDLCQRLAALKMKCGMMQNSFQGLTGEQQAMMASALIELQDATDLARGISKGLAPVALEAEGLMAALEELAQGTAQRYSVDSAFRCPRPVEIDDATVATHLFRIAQELITNAAKHAKPTRVDIGLFHAAGGIRLEVENDGRPFQGPVGFSDGMGLHFVQFRADSLGASLVFSPGELPDGGTRVICTVPLKEERE
ncbi:MAG: response regulator [Roseibacillus sp.]